MMDSLLEVISSAEYTASTGAKVVSLILTYSAIDTVSWLAAKSDVEPVGTRYRRWVGRYMLPSVPALRCTADEIYAARCGILHTMTGDAQLHDKKPLRRLAYAWGSADAARLQRHIDPLGESLVVVHVEDLTAGLRLGTAAFLEELPSDATIARRVNVCSGRFYANISMDSLKMP